MTPDIYKRYTLVDTTVGARLVLGFIVPATALKSRLPQPWQLSSLPASYLSAFGLNRERPPEQPNLLLVFNDLLLNQAGEGLVQADASARYVGFNIPAANPETGEHGMMHVRIFTGNPRSVPGRYRDALPARVRHEQRIIGEGTSSTVVEIYQIHPESGGSIELHLTYERGPLVRLVADRPNFPVWAALDSRILRVYQEDTLLEVVRNDTAGINWVQQETFRLTVPELADLFDGSERLVSIHANPHYARKTFSSGIEYADSAF
jgi:hypothetical protein